eukprot:scaffold9979_cov130-Cylindrotheca_fusiformis.AAC.2
MRLENDSQQTVVVSPAFSLEKISSLTSRLQSNDAREHDFACSAPSGQDGKVCMRFQIRNCLAIGGVMHHHVVHLTQVRERSMSIELDT